MIVFYPNLALTLFQATYDLLSKKSSKQLPYAFPISSMLDIEQTSTSETAKRNQLTTGI